MAHWKERGYTPKVETDCRPVMFHSPPVRCRHDMAENGYFDGHRCVLACRCGEKEYPVPASDAQWWAERFPR